MSVSEDRLDRLEKRVDKLKTQQNDLDKRLVELQKTMEEQNKRMDNLDVGIAQVKATMQHHRHTTERLGTELPGDEWITEEMLDETQRWFEEHREELIAEEKKDKDASAHL